MLPWIEQVIYAVNRCEEFAGKLSGLESGQVVIGCGSIQAATFLPPILSRFAIDYPDIEINLRIASSSDTIADLLANKVHLGIVSTVTDEAVNELLYKDSIVLIQKKDTDPNSIVTDNLTIENIIKNNRLLVFAHESGFRRFVDTYLTSRKIQPRSTLEINDVHVMIKLVEQQIGVAFAPMSAVDQHAQKDLFDIISPGGNSLCRHIYLIRDEKRPLSHAAERFVEVVRQHAHMMISTGVNEGDLTIPSPSPRNLSD